MRGPPTRLAILSVFKVADFRDTIRPWLFHNKLRAMTNVLREGTRPYVETASDTFRTGVETTTRAINLPRVVPEEKRILVIEDASTVTIKTPRQLQEETEMASRSQEEKLHGLEGQPIPPAKDSPAWGDGYLVDKFWRRVKSVQDVFSPKDSHPKESVQ